MKRSLRGQVLFGIVVFAFAAADSRATGQQIATSTFNIPPFTAGIPVGGQGGSEPGWTAPWDKIGGFNDRGHVVNSPTQEGNGAVQLFADNVFGTSIERHWSRVPVVRVDAYVYVTPGASMDAQIVNSEPAGEIDPRRAGNWRIDGGGGISVFDLTSNGYLSTGFTTSSNQWNEYSLIADTHTQTYSFLFNDQLYNPPHPLQFIDSTSYVDGINLRALQTLTSYVDHVTVTAVPEPSTIVLGGIGCIGMLFVAWRRRRLTSIPSRPE
jgi:hypothetical protein